MKFKYLSLLLVFSILLWFDLSHLFLYITDTERENKVLNFGEKKKCGTLDTNWGESLLVNLDVITGQMKSKATPKCPKYY